MRWEHLRGIGNNPLVRSSIVVPVIGYVILLNADVGNLLSLNPKLQIFHWSFPWKLVFTYYGSLSLGLGSLVYSFRCPQLIRNFPSAVRYALSDSAYFFGTKHYKRKITDIERTFFDATEKDLEGSPYSISSYQRAGPATSEEDAESLLTMAMTLEWHMANNSKRRSFYFAAALFAAGFALLLAPAVVTLTEVTLTALGAIGFPWGFRTPAMP